MFLIGLAPGAARVPIFLKLKEPERWKAAGREEDARAGGDAEQPQARARSPSSSATRAGGGTRSSACSWPSPGVVGLWGIGFFSFDLIRTRLPQALRRPQGPRRRRSRSPASSRFWTGITSLLQNAGAFFGIYAFSRVTHHIGRKPAFAISFVLAMVVDGLHVLVPRRVLRDLLVIPIMGFCQLSLFGGYAIYFPELFPTRLRSTGTSFCYNVGRLVAAAGPSAPRPADQPGLPRLSRADALRRRGDVPGLPHRPARPAVRARDAGQPLPE